MDSVGHVRPLRTRCGAFTRPKETQFVYALPPRRLAESVVALSTIHSAFVFVGSVKYLSQYALTQFAHKSFIDAARASPYLTMAKTLLVKRLAFEHEREVRVLVFTQRGEAGYHSVDILPYELDPHVLIDQIMIDPRQSAEAAERIKEKIAMETQFCGDILRSLLYAPPPRLVLDFKIHEVKKLRKVEVPPGWVQLLPRPKRSIRQCERSPIPPL